MSSCDVLNTRNTQVALKVEGTEGTAETLTSSDATMTVYDPGFSLDVTRFTRNPARASLSKLPSTVGRQIGTISFSVDLMGSGDVATEPSWDPALRACGFQTATVSSIMIGSVTGGPFEPGETIDFGTSGAVGRVCGEVSSSPLTFILVSGTPQSAETATGATSGASATTSGTETTDQGFEWLPDSTCPPSVTVAQYVDGVRHLIYGARGNVSWSGNSADGSPARMAFIFTGVYGGTTDTALLSGVIYESVVPPSFINVGFSMHEFGMTSSGCFSNFSLDMGNTLTQRESANAAKGVLSTFIGDREPAGSIDPEMVLVADHDFYGRLGGGDTGRMAFSLGSTAGNTITVGAPTVQYANVQGSDRGGILVAGLDFELKSATVATTDDELQLCMI